MSSDIEASLSTALRDLADGRPFSPDPDLIEQRGRALKHRVTTRVAVGDVAATRITIATAPDAGASPPPPGSMAARVEKAQGVDVLDNWIWSDATDALAVGAGQPQVREGVLRILATLPGVTVTATTVDGRSTLTLTAISPEEVTGDAAQLVIDARTGIPVEYGYGRIGQAPDTTTEYVVTRVSLAVVAVGKL